MGKKLIIVAAITLFGIYSISPTLIYFSMPKDDRRDAEKVAEAIPDWLPGSHVKLGLDLQGGVQLVLGVDTEDAVENKLSRMGTEITRWAEDEKMTVKSAYAVKGEQKLRVELGPDQDAGAFREKLKEEFVGLRSVDSEGNVIDYAYDDDQMERIKEGAEQQAERVIRTRVDAWGVSEPLIARRNDGSVLVQLPGFSDPDKAKELLGRTAQLQFKIVDDEFKGFAAKAMNPPEGITVEQSGGHAQFVGQDKDAIAAYLKDAVPEDRRVYFEREELAGQNNYRFRSYVTFAQTELSGEDILDTGVSRNSDTLDQSPVVTLRFTGPGGKRFADVTGAHVQDRMAIVLDDEIVSAPQIQGKITGGSAIITLGQGSDQQKFEEANELSLILKSGALPATIEVLEERQVGASLGPELAQQGVNAILLGLALVLFFMVAYYRRPGIVACVALMINGILLLALMAGFGFALTLPGIAGFILTLGMAVDANVLINERIRYELNDGRNAKAAIGNAFDKVRWTIIDANVTTLIAALVLLETNSSGPIRGFAVTLIIGLSVSLFTSLYVTRILFDTILANKTSDSDIRNWFGGEKALRQLNLGIDFLKYGKLVATIGVVLSLAVLGLGLTRGMNWSVDFAGGTEMEVQFAQEVDPGEIRSVAKDVGLKSMVLQALEGRKDKYLLRFDKIGGDDAQRDSIKVADELKAGLAKFNPDILRVDFVGPQIGKELRTAGAMSVFYALLGVLLYIAFRFDMRFAPGAIVKMVQDIFIMMGFYVFFWRSFDLTSVAALLTVVGYSVNDTIVIYDRIRENITQHPRRTLRENINIAVNETLSRTINTSLTTIIALAGILIFGTAQLWNFAAAMAIGVIVATISSAFLATSFIMWSEHWWKMKAQTAKAKKLTEAEASS